MSIYLFIFFIFSKTFRYNFLWVWEKSGRSITISFILFKWLPKPVKKCQLGHLTLPGKLWPDCLLVSLCQIKNVVPCVQDTEDDAMELVVENADIIDKIVSLGKALNLEVNEKYVVKNTLKIWKSKILKS